MRTRQAAVGRQVVFIVGIGLTGDVMSCPCSCSDGCVCVGHENHGK